MFLYFIHQSTSRKRRTISQEKHNLKKDTTTVWIEWPTHRAVPLTCSQNVTQHSQQLLSVYSNRKRCESWACCFQESETYMLPRTVCYQCRCCRLAKASTLCYSPFTCANVSAPLRYARTCPWNFVEVSCEHILQYGLQGLWGFSIWPFGVRKLFLTCEQAATIFGIPSLFQFKLKSFLFCKSSLPQPFLFLLQDSLYGFPRLFTVTSEHIRLFTF